MANNGSVRRISDKKKNRPRIRFNIWMLIIIFALSFAGCFVLFMVAANINDNFFEEEFGTIITETDSENNDNSQEAANSAEEATDGITATEPVTNTGAVISNPVPASPAADISYLDSCCLITDSTLLPIKEHGFTDVIGSELLGASTINQTKLQSSYGTVTAYETLKLKKPMNVYLMLGSDIGTAETDMMISEYMTFVSGLKSALPDMKIYIMQLPPVQGDTEKNTLINEYNARLLSLADTLGVYCLDTNTEFKGNDGNLNEKYVKVNEEDSSVSVSGTLYDDICGFILTHTV